MPAREKRRSRHRGCPGNDTPQTRHRPCPYSLRARRAAVSCPGVKYLGTPQSGSVANLTYSRNPFGQYVRARTGRGGTPAVPISAANAAWQALSQLQQIAWGRWSDTIIRSASLGARCALSGYQRFVSAYILAQRFGLSPLVSPPSGTPLPVILSVAASMAGSIITVNSAIDGAGYYQWQRVFPYSSGGTNFPPGRDAYWRSGVYAAALPTQTDVLNTGVTPPVGSRMFVRLRGVGLDLIPGPWVRAATVQL